MKNTYETGLNGEDLASGYLQQKHRMICLERRYRTRHGEIDLIMLDGETIVFVEVKTRNTGPSGNGLSAVNRSKQKRILQTAVLFLLKHQWMNRLVRFDLVEIHGNEITYVPNAFQPYGQFYH